MELLLNRIRIREVDGQPLNPRGAVRDTTDLQRSMAQGGQREDIQVYAENDVYIVIDGHRRVTAARAMGWKTIAAEVRPRPEDDQTLLAQMLASNVRENFAPSAMGRAMVKLAKDRRWGIERVAALCGLKTGKAQLYIDLTAAPEAVQRRVDSGEMSISAFADLRGKSAEVQEKAAALDNPTVRAVRQMVKQDKSKGRVADLLDAMNAEHTLTGDAQALRRRLMGEWHTLAPGEQTRLQEMLAGMLAYIQEVTADTVKEAN